MFTNANHHGLIAHGHSHKITRLPPTMTAGESFALTSFEIFRISKFGFSDFAYRRL
jgi:hypothetical protein